MYLFNEMAKLIAMLVNANVEFELAPFARYTIKNGKVTNEVEAWIEILAPNSKNPKISVSMTYSTQGGKDGLLELLKYTDNGNFFSEDPIGWLKAEEAFEYFPKEDRREKRESFNYTPKVPRIPRKKMRSIVDKFYNELSNKNSFTEKEEEFMFFYNEMLHYGEYEVEYDVDYLKDAYETYYEIK